MKRAGAKIGMWSLILLLTMVWCGFGPLETSNAAVNGMIRVKITRLGSPSAITMKTVGGFSVNGQGIASGSTVRVMASGSSVSLTVNGGSMGNWSALTLKRTGTGTSSGVRFTSPSLANLFCGDITFTASGGVISTVISMYVETYLYGVVGYEMGNSFPLEALKAQAVTARTFAMKYQKTSGSYDVNDTTSYQVFRGYDGSLNNVIAAVNGTKGVCLTFGGSYITALYSASNGGHTVSNSSIWGSTAMSYLPSKADPYDLENPSSMVKSHRVPMYPTASDPIGSSLNSALKSAMGIGSGVSITQVVSMTPHTEKYGSGTLTYQYIRFTVVTSDGQTRSCDLGTYSRLEGMLGLNITSSALETVAVEQGSGCFYIRFRRFGHGVGMSQRGAQWMAKQYGKGYKEILDFYYPGAKIVTLTLYDTASGTSKEGKTEESPYGEGALYYGCTGSEVKKLQTRLKELGYYSGSIGGNYLDQTVAAVSAFQKDKGLEVDGIATLQVQKLLYGTAQATSTPKSESGYTTLKYGDSGDAVKKLQSKLKELGYFSGNIGGNYKDQTVAAVKKYQKAMGLTQDGVATAELQKMLYEGAKPTPAPTPTSTPTPPPTPAATPAPTPDPQATQSPYKTLKKGVSGDAVKKLQSKLKELGYFDGTIGGNYQDKTATAVKKYQRAKGLEETGVATPELQAMLFAETKAAPAPTAAPTAAPAATAEPVSQPTAVPAPTAQPTAAPKYAPLKYGDKGDEVKKLQSRLKELGFFDGNIGGNYLDQTVAAVKKYQKSIGVEADGVASSALLEKLYVTRVKPAATPAPQATPVPVPQATATPTPKTGEDSGKYKTLKYGDKGDEVKKLQTRLKELGYFSGNVGGNYLDITVASVKSYQKAMGLTQDGIASPELQKQLFEGTSPAAPKATAKPTAKPTTAPVAKATPAPGSGGSSSGGALSPGDSGSAVKKLQKRLQALGYFSGSIGGNYKDQTTSAVKAFQKKVKLSQTGVADSETQTLLYSSGAPKKSATLKEAYVKDGGATLRQTASSAGKQVTTIPAGSKVTVLCKMSGWTRVQYGDDVGYVPTNDLQGKK